MQQLTNLSYGSAKAARLLSQFGITTGSIAAEQTQLVVEQPLEKAVTGGKLNTSHLVLKDITINGKTAKRWVDPNKGDKEHAPHGSKVNFEHEGKQMTGTAGRVSSSGKYVVKDDAGNQYKKAHHEIKRDTNTPHHQLARKKDDSVLQRYAAHPKAKPEFKDAAEDVLAERQQAAGTNTDPNDKSASNGQKNDQSGNDNAQPKPAAQPANAKQAQKKVDDIEDKDEKDEDDVEEESEAQTAMDISERFRDFSDYVKGVVQGKKKAAIMYGSGGVGKTFTTKAQLEKQFGKDKQFDPDTHTPGSDDYDYVFIDGGKVTSTGFWKNMYQHNGKIIVFDDCDSALEDPNIKGYLKGALGSSQSQVTNSSGKAVKDDEGNPIPQQFNFNGKMVFISNLPKDKILNKDMQPVMSRSYSMDMTMDRKQTMAYIKHISTNKKTGELTNMKFDGLKYDHDEMKHVVDYLDKHKEHAFDLNARTVETLLGIYQLSKERVQEDELDGNSKFTNDKERDGEIMKNFNRKAIQYLYQHKMENGKIDKKYIAKSLVDVLGGTMDEIHAWKGLGIFSLGNFFDVKLEKGLEDLLN